MNIGIYWPRISLPETSVTWIKGTILFWDSIARIVPGDYQPNDHPDIRALEEECVLTRVEPSQRNASGTIPLEMVHEAFRALLDDQDALHELQDRYGLDKASEWRQSVSSTMASYEGGDHDPRYGYLLGSRVWGPLRSRLIEVGLAKQMKKPGWLGVHPLLADACIRSLAVAMEAEGWSPVTDQTNVFAAGSFTLETLRETLLGNDPDCRPPGRANRSELIACVMEGLHLDGIEDVQVKEILRIRKKHAAVRQTFLGEIDKISKVIKSSPNPQQREIALRAALRERIEGPLENLRSDLLKLNVGTGASAATTFIGALLKGTTTALLPIDVSLTAFAVGGCALVPLVSRRFAEGGPAQKHPMGYLHLLERDLTAAKDVAERLKKAREMRLKAEWTL